MGEGGKGDGGVVLIILMVQTDVTDTRLMALLACLHWINTVFAALET